MERKENTRCGRKFKLEAVRVAAIGERPKAQLQITPSIRKVRTVRGFSIQLVERPGLCRKTRQSIPAAIRKCLEKNPDIVYAILNARDLLGAG